jgi:hypothetical protein
MCAEPGASLRAAVDLRGAVAALAAEVGLRSAAVTADDAGVLAVARPTVLPTVAAHHPVWTVGVAPVHIVLAVVPATEPPARAVADLVAARGVGL